MNGPARSTVRDVLSVMRVEPRLVRIVHRDAESGDGNVNWHVWPQDGSRVVLRRYHVYATREDLDYEHAVLRQLAGLGWAVPYPVGPLLRHDGRWYCLTAYVPGRPRASARETARQRRQRGADLARLHAAMAPLAVGLGQRPRWRAQHESTTVHADLHWESSLQNLSEVHPALADWAAAANNAVREELRALGADALQVTAIHGDFAEWNVHYLGARLVGVIDFGLTHLDSRPYELAVARTYRSPEVRDGYAAELARIGWPLSELELAAIGPVDRAFRVDMVAWLLQDGVRTGRFDTNAIARQLARTGTERPDQLAAPQASARAVPMARLASRFGEPDGGACSDHGRELGHHG